MCSVPWGREVCSTVGEYLEHRGVFSTVGDIMMNVGDMVFSTVGDIMSTVGSYLEYRGELS